MLVTKIATTKRNMVRLSNLVTNIKAKMRQMKKKTFFKFESYENKQLNNEIFRKVDLYLLGKQLRSTAIGYMAHNNEKKDTHRQN